MTSTQQYVLISIKQEALFKAIGVYQNEQDAYAAATVCQMQSIEKRSAKWPKSMLADKQESIMELCRCIKEDFKSYKERFAYMTLQCSQIFVDLEYDQHRVLPVEANNNIPSQSISESIFKTKVRNFMDVLRTRSDVEEDLGNSEDDVDEDDEDEEDEDEDDEEDDEEDENDDDGEHDGDQDLEEEVDGEEDMEEEDIDQDVDEEAEEDQDEDIQDEEDEEEPATSETIIQEHSEEEELEEDQERPTLKRDASSLLDEGDAEDDEEDEIDEDDGDEDELADDDDESVKRRRVAA